MTLSQMVSQLNIEPSIKKNEIKKAEKETNGIMDSSKNWHNKESVNRSE